METKQLKIAFSDARGTITDILDNVDLNSVSLITSKKGVVRGNHFHKKTVQYLFVLKGRLEYVSRKGNGPVCRKVLSAGGLAVSPPGEAHTIKTLESTAFLALSRGPRHGGNYEADTYRLSVPLVAPDGKKRRGKK